MDMKSNSQAMETEKIPRLLAQLAIPAVVAQIINLLYNIVDRIYICLLYTSPSPRDKRQSRMPSSA